MATIMRKGVAIEYKDKEIGYITITESIRVRLEGSIVVIEELSADGETWGNFKYYTSWEGALKKLIRNETNTKIGKKGIVTLQEGLAEWMKSLNEIKTIAKEIHNGTK